jgi:FkbM family methyltransferase
VSDRTVISHAQNREDVVLWRALGHLPTGRYVDVGANEPSRFSVSRLFYDHGWSGVAVEPVPSFAQQFREARPRDVVVEAALTTGEPGTTTMTAFEGTGLSTLDDAAAGRHRGAGYEGTAIEVATTTLQAVVDEHLAGEEVQFCSVDVEGHEAAVLASADLTRFRPWVLVVEATAPLSTEQRHQEWEPALLEAGYRFRLFDGLSRFYVAAEHDDRIGPALSYPACPFDDYVPADVSALHHRLDDLQDEVGRLRSDLVHWRAAVLEHWTRAASGQGPAPDVSAELEAMRATVSWRVTAPLRAVRSGLGAVVRR